MSSITRVAILDDHPPIIEGYCSRLRAAPNIEIAGTASSGEEIQRLLAEKPVDVLLLDVIVPVSQINRSPYPILHYIPQFLQAYPNMAVLVISMHNQQTLIKAVVEAGSSGYILKDDPNFLHDLPLIVESVAHGGVYFSQQAHQAMLGRKSRQNQLTSRQLEVLSLCAAHPDASTAELAQMLKVANSTLRNLLSGAYLVLEVHSRVAAVAKAQQLGLVTAAVPLVNLQELSESQPDDELPA